MKKKLLMLALLLSAVSPVNHQPVNLDDNSFDENNVVLSFGGITDTHCNPNYPKYRKAMGNMIDYLEELNNNSPLDGLVIGGDLVDTTWSTEGTNLVDFKEFTAEIHDKIDPDQTALFYTMGNHDVDPTSTRGEDCANVGKYYFNYLGKEYFKNDVNYLEMFDESGQATDKVTNNRHMVLNNHHFIAVTPKYFWNIDNAFTEETITWLRNALSDAAKEDPSKPIFVVSHAPIMNSVRASENENWAYRDLENVLSDYPQVVYLSGHIHNLIADSLCIEQRNFTMVDLGTTKNSGSFNTYETGNYKWNNYEGDYYYENAIGSIDISSGAFFQVDNKGNIKISRFIVNADESIKGVLKPWYIDSPKEDLSHLVRYNDEYRKATNERPYFKDDGALLISQRDNNCVATVSSAFDEEYVEYYQFTLKTIYGQTIWSKQYQTFYFKDLVNENTSPKLFNLGNISEGKYLLEVRAGDVWHAVSDPLVTVLKVEKEATL